MVSWNQESPPRAAALQQAEARLLDGDLQSAEDGVVETGEPPACSSPATSRSLLSDCGQKSAEDGVVGAGEPPARAQPHLGVGTLHGYL